jgi:hypothetical protein
MYLLGSSCTGNKQLDAHRQHSGIPVFALLKLTAGTPAAVLVY